MFLVGDACSVKCVSIFCSCCLPVLVGADIVCTRGLFAAWIISIQQQFYNYMLAFVSVFSLFVTSSLICVVYTVPSLVRYFINSEQAAACTYILKTAGYRTPGPPKETLDR